MRGFVEELERQEYNAPDPGVDHMEHIADYLDRLRLEILQECSRKLMSGGIDPESYKPEGYQAARAIVSVVLIEKGRSIFNNLSAKTKKDARKLMFF